MINVALVGVGSFAKALLEGVSFYTTHPNETIGLAHPLIGPYKISDIDFVAAFDVDERKVGQKLHDAISMGRNLSYPICDCIQFSGSVYKGPCMDSLIPQLEIQESPVLDSNVAHILKETKTDIVLNLLPSGSNQAAIFYASQALIAGCHFINAIPTPLANLKIWQRRFKKNHLILCGDDLKSQFGATMLNRLILQALKQRGIYILRSHQHNKGGNADHLNLVYRAQEKMESKQQTLEHFLSADDGKVSVSFEYTGVPSSHKLVQLIIETQSFGKAPLIIDATIEDEISLNGAGIAVDAIRAVKLLAEHQDFNAMKQVCAFLFKNPPLHMSDDKAFASFNRILEKYKVKF